MGLSDGDDPEKSESDDRARGVVRGMGDDFFSAVWTERGLEVNAEKLGKGFLGEPGTTVGEGVKTVN